jgi:hypothetical protein
VIVYQDFSERQISWPTLPALFVLFFIEAVTIKSTSLVLTSIAFNLMFIVLQMILLSLWMSLRLKKWTNIIDVYLGLGDLLFFVVLSCIFEPLNFIIFYLSSLMLTLLGYACYRLLQKNGTPEIPLAGSMAIVLIACIIFTLSAPGFSLEFTNLVSIH